MWVCNNFFLYFCITFYCFLDGCFLHGCFLGGCFLDGCFLNGWSWPKSLQNSLGRNWMPIHHFFSFLAIAPCYQHSTWLLRPVRVSTSSELYPNTWLFDCLGIQFFNSLTCDLRDTMPRQRSPTFIPREAKDFPRGDSHSKHLPLPTYLAWLQPITIVLGFYLYMSKLQKFCLWWRL